MLPSLCQRAKGKSAKGGVITQEILDEKEERIQHLEEVNRMLKQTNDDYMEEIEELRQKMAMLTSEVREEEGEGRRASGRDI